MHSTSDSVCVLQSMLTQSLYLSPTLFEIPSFLKLSLSHTTFFFLLISERKNLIYLISVSVVVIERYSANATAPVSVISFSTKLCNKIKKDTQ